MTQMADTIITNAKVFTADPALPRAEAVAIRGNRLIFVGSEAAAHDLRTRRTKMIDGQGGTLLPGFIDSHFHLLSGSLQLDDIQLGQVTSLPELTEAVTRCAASQADRAWLVGSGLRYDVLPPETPLTRHHLDALVADRPLALLAYDLHTAWANTEALLQAGLLGESEPVAPNSEIVRDASGLATGELRERGAYDPLLDQIPPPTEAQKYELLHQGLAQAAAFGITSIHNMDGNAAQLARYAALDEVGELTLRIYCPVDIVPATPPEALLEAVAMQQMCRGDKVRSGCVKFFMDGVVENFTAYLLDDYAGQPGRRGGTLYSPEHFTRMATEADALGLQIFVHAVGDGAVRQTLDGFAAVRRANGPRDSRHRIEHIELIHPDDLPRFAELDVIASMQPDHAIPNIDDTDPWPRLVSPSRWACAFAWQAIKQAGARLVFGSDWPVVGQNPLDGLHITRNRRPWAKGLPDQRLSLGEALLAYTREAAYAEFQEHQKGQLAPGMLADMVLLSADLFATPDEAINQVRPVLTMCDGRVVYER
ncbi:MAG: amidohydrolase [Anaerolineae bacterium]|nr:amidohydrolase [Anaerolineae bacterium]